ncbi:hypothetical protein [Corynebacterium provencense]|uniref:8-oxoguanine DNA glycosylase OGG fold protein n=1 Tax=Corynebacterium provencense TaxID=1737425 RepID=UPI0013A613CB|nr:hypothetical protein [Corynebacterium provencense]
MTRTLNMTVALKALGEPAQCPALDQVRGQKVWFYPRHWLARWPQGLEIPPLLQGDDDVDVRLAVTRDDLFALAANGISTPSEAVNFYTAVCAWGNGPYVRGVSRVVRPLRDPLAPGRLLEGLAAAAECGAGSGDPVEIYRQFCRGGSWRIKYLGPAFFTKLMYFAAGAPVPPKAECSSTLKHPLILDSRVARALGWSRRWGWSPEQYGDYLEAVEELRDLWRPEVPVDVVEYQLFITGGRKN